MKFIPVESSMILGVRYNEVSRYLDIIFRTGDTYRYKSVPKSIYQELLEAKSQGQYMHEKVLGQYEYERLG